MMLQFGLVLEVQGHPLLPQPLVLQLAVPQLDAFQPSPSLVSEAVRAWRRSWAASPWRDLKYR